MYREDLDAFLDELEVSLKSRQVPRQTLTRTSFLNIDELPESAEVPLPSQLKTAVKAVKDIIGVSNRRIDEISHDDIELSVKNKIRDLLLKLNSDIYDKLEDISLEAESIELTISELLENIAKLRKKLDNSEEEVKHTQHAYHVLSRDFDHLKLE